MVEDIIAAIEVTLRGGAIIALPTEDQPDIRIYFEGRMAVLHADHGAPLWNVVERASGRSLASGEESTVGDAVRAAIFSLLEGDGLGRLAA